MIAVAAVAVLLAVTVAGLGLGAAVIARHRAQAAADLAALAAATRLAVGPAAACEWAGALAGKMGGTVTDCTVDGLDVVVIVEVSAAVGTWQVGPAHARARAGPVANRS